MIGPVNPWALRHALIIALLKAAAGLAVAIVIILLAGAGTWGTCSLR